MEAIPLLVSKSGDDGKRPPWPVQKIGFVVWGLWDVMAGVGSGEDAVLCYLWPTRSVGNRATETERIDVVYTHRLLCLIYLTRHRMLCLRYREAAPICRAQPSWQEGVKQIEETVL